MDNEEIDKQLKTLKTTIEEIRSERKWKLAVASALIAAFASICFCLHRLQIYH